MMHHSPTLLHLAPAPPAPCRSLLAPVGALFGPTSPPPPTSKSLLQLYPASWPPASLHRPSRPSIYFTQPRHHPFKSKFEHQPPARRVRFFSLLPSSTAPLVILGPHPRENITTRLSAMLPLARSIWRPCAATNGGMGCTSSLALALCSLQFDAKSHQRALSSPTLLIARRPPPAARRPPLGARRSMLGYSRLVCGTLAAPAVYTYPHPPQLRSSHRNSFIFDDSSYGYLFFLMSC
ncbi:hypothetical protein C8R43DRAFT_1143567 [Mycena crocata]|nr:hypothetical protein C8R43DRAFT_1143567 [Mycena crocata]